MCIFWQAMMDQLRVATLLLDFCESHWVDAGRYAVEPGLTVQLILQVSPGFELVAVLPRIPFMPFNPIQTTPSVIVILRPDLLADHILVHHQS
jgi:hypothetical protein